MPTDRTKWRRLPVMWCAVGVMYPDIPEEARTGLCLFGAAFNGANDAAFMLDADLTVTVVDTDAAALTEMEKHYPSDWKFVCCDAFRFARDAGTRGARWDVVSVDPFTNLMSAVVRRWALFDKLTTMMLVIGARPDDDLKYLPDVAQEMKRSGIASWLVLRRNAWG